MHAEGPCHFVEEMAILGSFHNCAADLLVPPHRGLVFNEASQVFEATAGILASPALLEVGGVDAGPQLEGEPGTRGVHPHTRLVCLVLLCEVRQAAHALHAHQVHDAVTVPHGVQCLWRIVLRVLDACCSDGFTNFRGRPHRALVRGVLRQECEASAPDSSEGREGWVVDELVTGSASSQQEKRDVDAEEVVTSCEFLPDVALVFFDCGNLCQDA
mmetsp:Transcript_89905/g.187956  ORF Transcript_89905/g.187956 Transcript_89905/m.187956 type:complete len:215 (+) Transcript_89905:316-960(+)